MLIKFIKIDNIFVAKTAINLRFEHCKQVILHDFICDENKKIQECRKEYIISVRKLNIVKSNI